MDNDRKANLRMHALAGVILLTLLGVLLAGCTGSMNKTGDDAVTNDSHVSKLVIGEVLTVTDTNYFDQGLGNLIWQLTDYGLVKFDKDGEIIPALAESWETTDLKRWVFHLRRNATWHDGEPVTSADIKYTVEFNKANKPEDWQSVYGDVVSIETPDPYTVVFDLKNPDYNFLTTVEVMCPIPEHIYKDVADPRRYNDPDKALVGTGPYVFESFDPDAATITYKAYDKFWEGRPAVDTIEIKIYKSLETLMMALQKGEVDATYKYAGGVSYYYVPSLLKNPDIDYMLVKSGGWGNVIWINTNRTPLDNKDLRQAMTYAINYDELVNLFTAGYGAAPDAGFMPEGSLNYVATRKLTYDVNKSKLLLDAVGFGDTDGDGFREMPDGKPLKLTLSAQSSVSDQVRLAEMLKKYFVAAGINLDLKLMDTNTFWTMLDVDKTYDLGLAGSTFWGMNMGAGYACGYVDTRYYGWSMVSDPQYQALIDQIKVTLEKDKRKAVAADIQGYYADEMPQIPLYTMDVIQPYNKKYEGWTYNVYYGIMCPDTFYNLHKA